MNKAMIKKSIISNYSKVARNGAHGGCCQGGCGCGKNSGFDAGKAAISNGYIVDDLLNAPDSANMGLGCGNPVAIAQLAEGETVVDLGCGGGFDCILAGKRVGDSGYVIGVDMTPAMVELARANIVKSSLNNIDIRLGDIERLPIEDEAADVVISNCVINLCADKKRAFNEVFRVLKKGGRLSISDIALLSALPRHIKADISMLSGCISGAASIESLSALLSEAGFGCITICVNNNSKEIISSWYPGSNIEDYVSSVMITAIKK